MIFNLNEEFLILKIYFVTVFAAHFNLVAMVVTEFVLITFTLLNYATFRACLVKPLGWRPPFKVLCISDTSDVER